jgi:RNA polymerase-interacting CarD/CdnL/TRCF family regulator
MEHLRDLLLIHIVLKVAPKELTNQLNQVNKDKGKSSQIQQSADVVTRNTKFQPVESNRQRARLEEENKLYEAQVQSLRQAIDVMV